MTITELVERATTEDDKKRILLAYLKGRNDGLSVALQLITEDESDADRINDT